MADQSQMGFDSDSLLASFPVEDRARRIADRLSRSLAAADSRTVLTSEEEGMWAEWADAVAEAERLFALGVSKPATTISSIERTTSVRRASEILAAWTAEFAE